MADLIQQLPDWARSSLAQNAVVALVTLVAIFVVVKIAQRLVVRRIEESSARYRVRRAIAFTGYLVSAIILLSLFDNDFGRLTLVIGGISAGVAFALQEVIASLAGWLSLTVGGVYGVGDRVQIAGIRGDVIAVSPLRTTLIELGGWVEGDLYNGRLVRVANSFVFKEPVFNYSADFSFLWDEMRVPIRLDSDRSRAQDLLYQALVSVVGEASSEAEREWRAMQDRFAVESASLAPTVKCTFDENWITYRLRYVIQAKARRSIKHELSVAVLDAIAATDGAVRVAGSSMEISDGSRIDVRSHAAELAP